MLISIIIPAYNEEKHIGATIGALNSLMFPKEVLVIDDGSTDETFNIALAMGATGIRTKENRGKGAALEEGLLHARGDIIVFLDADIAGGAAEVERLLSPVISDRAQMAVAIFPPALKKGGFGLVKTMAKFGVFLMTGEVVNWSLSGQRAFRREIIGHIPLARGFGIEVGQTIEVLRRQYTVEEVPVEMCHRESGRDLKGFLHRGRQFMNILSTLFQIALKRWVK